MNINTILQEINNLLPDNHTQEISESDVRTAFQKTLSGIQNGIERLSIGGRNIISGTKDMSGNLSSTTTQEQFLGLTVARSSFTQGSYAEACSFLTEIIPHGTDFTLSFWAKANAPTTIYCYFFSPNTTLYGESSTGQSSTSIDGACQVSLTTQWKQYWVKWKQTTPNAVKNVIIGRTYTVGNTISVAGVKLESGRNVTDWTPSPEDVEKKITTLFKNLPDATSDPTYNKILVVKPNGNLATINRT